MTTLRPSLRRRLAAAFIVMTVLGWWIVTVLALTFIALLRASVARYQFDCLSIDIPLVPSALKCTPSWNLPERWVVGSLLAAAVAGVACLCWVMAGRILRPLTAAADQVRQLGPQNLGQRIRMDGSNDELKRLSDAIDDALDRLAAGYEGQRRFAANASHELRTPLAVQRLLTEVAMDDPAGSPDLRHLGAQLLRASDRSERLIEGLLVLAEADRGLPGRVPVRLDEVTQSVVDAHADLAARHGVTLRPALAGCLVPGDPVLLERLVVNLVTNAVAYNEPGGWVEIEVEPSPALTVRNTGPEVPAEAVPGLFEPFRRLADRTSHRGAGLGLSIVASIAAAHDGTASARPRPGGGLTVTVSLPGAARPPGQPAG